MAAPPERLRLRFVADSVEKQRELDKLARKKEEQNKAKNDAKTKEQAEASAKELAFLVAEAKKLTVGAYKPPIIDSDPESNSKLKPKINIDLKSKSNSIPNLRLMCEAGYEGRLVKWNEDDKEGCYVTAARSKGIEVLVSLLPGSNKELVRYSMTTTKKYILGDSATFICYLKRDGADIAKFVGHFRVKNVEASEVELVKLIH